MRSLDYPRQMIINEVWDNGTGADRTSELAELTQSTVDRERLEGFFVTSREMSISLVHHLNDADDIALNHNRHAQQCLRFIACLQIDFSTNGEVR